MFGFMGRRIFHLFQQYFSLGSLASIIEFIISIISAASRGSATTQVGVVGQVRFTASVLVSARSVTKRVSEQCLCNEEGELERQNACAVIR